MALPLHAMSTNNDNNNSNNNDKNSNGNNEENGSKRQQRPPLNISFVRRGGRRPKSFPSPTRPAPQNFINHNNKNKNNLNTPSAWIQRAIQGILGSALALIALMALILWNLFRSASSLNGEHSSFYYYQSTTSTLYESSPQSSVYSSDTYSYRNYGGQTLSQGERTQVTVERNEKGQVINRRQETERYGSTNGEEDDDGYNGVAQQQQERLRQDNGMQLRWQD